jgi:hypothetical protein
MRVKYHGTIMTINSIKKLQLTVKTQWSFYQFSVVYTVVYHLKLKLRQIYTVSFTEISPALKVVHHIRSDRAAVEGFHGNAGKSSER